MARAIAAEHLLKSSISVGIPALVTIWRTCAPLVVMFRKDAPRGKCCGGKARNMTDKMQLPQGRYCWKLHTKRALWNHILKHTRDIMD